MNTDMFEPSAEVAEDFKALQSSAFDDPGGERLRRLVGYFESAEMKGMQMRLQSEDFEQKAFAGLLCDAFAAARRIVLVATDKGGNPDAHKH